MSKRSKVQIIHQTLLDVDHPQIQLSSYHENDLSDTIFDAFLGCGTVTAIGISVAYAPRSGALSAVALAVAERILVIQLSSPGKSGKRSSIMLNHMLESRILLSTGGWSLFGFDMDAITLGLWKYHDLSVADGVDIQSVCTLKGARLPLVTMKFCLGDDIDVYGDNVGHVFNNMAWEPKLSTDLAQRSWISWFLAVQPGMEEKFREVPRINIGSFTPMVLTWLAKTIHDSQNKEEQKQVVHEYSGARVGQQGKLEIQQERFQTRIQRSHQNQNLQMRVNSSEGSYVVNAIPTSLQGRRAQIGATSDVVLEGKSIGSLVTTGVGAPTQAEGLKASIVLGILQKKIQPFNNPWLQLLYLGQDPTWPSSPTPSLPPLILSPTHPLNDSQFSAASQMLSRTEDHRITVIQGPPGTGKTSVIGQFVVSAISSGLTGIWLVAKSNVAVKNIAEKLYNLDFMAWRLIVSAEFHNDWHEHLYTSIQKNVICSDELSRMSPNVVHQRFNGCQVILCTLDMLSNAQLKYCGVTRLISIQTLVVDEASQIDVSDYISAFRLFESSLRKVCFIGDNKQLPPYGQESNKDLKSIFEIPYLIQKAIFLDIQYRMPPVLGKFISQHIYEDKLQSNPQHPVTGSTCFFIDVMGGQEISKDTSWKNLKECIVAAFIARHLEDRDLSYRVITPYDAQRSSLEEYFKSHDLTWKDRCFNVDSFQGNEDDYIILSLVRTQDIGFLKDLRRTNVMLTRCRRGMFICTTRAFIEGAGSKTLAGKMAAQFGEDAWLTKDDFERFEF